MLWGVTPWIAVIGLAFVILMQQFEKMLDKRGWGPPFPFRYVVYLYGILIWILVGSFSSMVRDVWRKTAILDPDITQDFVKDRMRIDNDTVSFEEWSEEASLKEYPGLRLFSLLSPFWVVATLVICVYHTIMHVRQMIKYGHHCNPDAMCTLDEDTSGQDPVRRALLFHDKTIRILALPVFYGLMSLQAVIRSWGIVINDVGEHHFHSWLQRKEYLEDMYDETFMVGDMYESYALLIFGNLIMLLIKLNNEEKVQEVEKCLQLHANVHSPQQATSIRDLAKSTKLFILETKGLTVLGIKLFCLTCSTQGFYALFVISAGFYGWYPEYFGTGDQHQGILMTESAQNMVHFFFYGAGFMASFAAIGNIVEVERGFHSSLVEFSPCMKFWGTKVLVSIAFLQSIVLAMVSPVCWWSKTRRDLFYAALLCFECFVISLFHLVAWPPRESWYTGEAHYSHVGDSSDNETSCSASSGGSVCKEPSEE